MKPLVSIVICTKNRAKLLPRAVNSALSQTYDNTEFIIVDCASTDETSHVLSRYTDSRLRVITLEQDPGREETLVIGLKAASGKYVTFLDDDDVFLPQKVEKQVEVFEENGHEVGIVYCWGTIVNDKTGSNEEIISSVRGNVYKDTLQSMCLCSFISLMFRREMLTDDQVFDRSSNFYPSDWYYINKITRKYLVEYVAQNLFEIHKNTVYTRMSQNLGFDSNYWADIHLRFHSLFLSDNAEGFKKYPLASKPHVYSIISSAGILGRLSEAAKYYLFGLQRYPLNIVLHKRMIAAIYRTAKIWSKKCKR